jgi:exodeoxyribonuclease-1
MAQTFYFYDTETSGARPSSARIMQFAGIRTDKGLNVIGEPDDILIKLSPDILPEPDAILVHCITPQQTVADGITEAEFCRYFQEKIALPETVFIGFNSVRFDDEFVRYTMYRNFYEPYEWQWKDGRSRFDLLDMLRMMRALRPDGLEWPVDDEGRPTVKLTSMTAANGLDHENAHTAIADVAATVDLAKLVYAKQPKLFTYLLNIRGKRDVAALVEKGEPFVYTSGKYPSEYLKTTLAFMLFKKPKRDAAIVYDLRVDPAPYLSLPVEDLTAAWERKRGEEGLRLPVKTLHYNHCPAVAPRSVLDAASMERIGLVMEDAERHLAILKDNMEFIERLGEALGIMDEKQTALQLQVEEPHVDTQLYDSFWSDHDRVLLGQIRDHSPATLAEILPKLTSKRMQKLLPLYKARNYPEFLSPEERDAWEVYRQEKLLLGGEDSAYARFARRLQSLASERSSSTDQYLLTELQLYAESIMPETD